MTPYSEGFFRKCAEYGVPYDSAVAMYKAATNTNAVASAASATPNIGSGVARPGAPSFVPPSMPKDGTDTNRIRVPLPQKPGMNKGITPPPGMDGILKYIRNSSTNAVSKTAESGISQLKQVIAGLAGKR